MCDKVSAFVSDFLSYSPDFCLAKTMFSLTGKIFSDTMKDSEMPD